MTISHSGTALMLSTRLPATGLSCTYSGSFSQLGRMGKAEGTYTCSDGASGPFALSEIEASDHGFFASLRTNLRGCIVHGHLGGTRINVQQLPD